MVLRRSRFFGPDCAVMGSGPNRTVPKMSVLVSYLDREILDSTYDQVVLGSGLDQAVPDSGLTWQSWILALTRQIRVPASTR